jgi:molecular chaperone IbpA
MRGFDMTPLLRTTVGFDRLARTLDSLATDQAPSYPPYNIEKLDENDYVISMAVAGFSEDDLEISVQENTLTVKGRIVADESDEPAGRQYLHRGIATRAFERQFSLADHIKVADAKLENGLLHIALHREVPEEAKPRTIPIATDAKGKRKAIEKKAA